MRCNESSSVEPLQEAEMTFLGMGTLDTPALQSFVTVTATEYVYLSVFLGK